MSTHRAGDGVHTVVVRDPMWGYWNKALGFCEPVTDETVAEAVERAAARRRRRPSRSSSSRASSPTTGTRSPSGTGSPRARCSSSASARPSRARSRPTCGSPGSAPRTRPDFTDVMAVGFGFEATPEADAFFDGAHFFDGDWASYGAYDGDTAGRRRPDARGAPRPSAVALFGAATLPEGRNRGAQGALLDVRIREARDRGLRYASAETWLENDGEPQPVAAQHAPGRAHRGAHAARTGCGAARRRADGHAVLQQPQHRALEDRSAARAGVAALRRVAARSWCPPRRRPPRAGRRTTSARAPGCCRGTPRPPSSPPPRPACATPWCRPARRSRPATAAAITVACQVRKSFAVASRPVVRRT